jgi:hypothetical protein
MPAARMSRRMRLQGVPGSCPGQQTYEAKDVALGALVRARLKRTKAGGSLSIGLRSVIGGVLGHSPGLCWRLAANVAALG